MEDVILPILEGSMVLAAHYTKACGRSTVTALDLNYALKYCAQHEVGTHIGSMFPELYEDSESDEDDIEVVDDEDEPFTRYTGEDEWCIKLNAAFDSWDTWEPFSPAEKMLKRAIDQKNI
jgi:hypothetical protein